MINVLNRLNLTVENRPDSVELVEAMAQRFGFNGIFTLYTFDNEFPHEKPHVHICVKNDNSNFEGTTLYTDKSLKSVGKIILNPEPPTRQTLEIDSKNYFTTKQRKLFVEWLTKDNNTKFKKCLEAYLLSNGFGLNKPEAYSKIVREIFKDDLKQIKGWENKTQKFFDKVLPK